MTRDGKSVTSRRNHKGHKGHGFRHSVDFSVTSCPTPKGLSNGTRECCGYGTNGRTYRTRRGWRARHGPPPPFGTRHKTTCRHLNVLKCIVKLCIGLVVHQMLVELYVTRCFAPPGGSSQIRHIPRALHRTEVVVYGQGPGDRMAAGRLGEHAVVKCGVVCHDAAPA